MRRPAEIANDELRIELCGPQERAAQAQLFNAVFKKHVDAAALAWRYDRGPHGAAISILARAPQDAGGGGVCGYACSPRIVVPGDEPAAAAAIGETGDVMTHPDWRKRGIFSALDDAALDEARRRGWPCVFGLPNRHSAHIFLAKGWRQVGEIRHWTHLLRSDGAARAERLREGRWRSWRTPLDARRAAVARRALGRGPAFVSRELSAFPEGVDELVRSALSAHALYVRRDKAYLDWRFLQNPSRLHRAFALERGGRLAGYVVVQLPRAGEGRGWLVDAVGVDEDARRAAIGAGIEALRAAGASFVQANAIERSTWQRALAAAGFVPPRPGHGLIVIVHVLDPAHPISRAALDASRWFLTDGDRDDETVG